MKKTLFLGRTFLISSSLTLILSHQSFSAETCIPLKVVGGEKGQTLVQKTVSAPSIPIGIGRLKRDDWNTDFSIGSDNKYKRFVATLTPQTQGTYDIKMNLKYSDGTADEVFNQKSTLSPGKPLVIPGSPRAGAEPYQINIFVGDVESVGKSYNISVKACR